MNNILIFLVTLLGASVLIVPFTARLGLGSVIGYLLAGANEKELISQTREARAALDRLFVQDMVSIKTPDDEDESWG
ncbi:MAG: hypothetical protein H7249_08240 [Chitinophagaceae bacterium]|nr:hypothetical protein [Oligoflexus sp.]